MLQLVCLHPALIQVTGVRSIYTNPSCKTNYSANNCSNLLSFHHVLKLLNFVTRFVAFVSICGSYNVVFWNWYLSIVWNVDWFKKPLSNLCLYVSGPINVPDDTSPPVWLKWLNRPLEMKEKCMSFIWQGCFFPLGIARPFMTAQGCAHAFVTSRL